MKKVIYDIKFREEEYPVKIEIKKKFKIIPPLEQRKAKFLIKIKEREKEVPGRIRCYLINPENEDVIHKVEFTKEKEVEVGFGYAGYYKWCCGSRMSEYIEPTWVTRISDIVGYKIFRVYSIYELVTVIGAFAAIIAAITGFLALLT